MVKEKGVQIVAIRKRDGSKKGYHFKRNGFIVYVGPILLAKNSIEGKMLDMDYAVKTHTKKYTTLKEAESQANFIAYNWNITMLDDTTRYIY